MGKIIYMNPNYPSSDVSEFDDIKKEYEALGYELIYDQRSRTLTIDEMIGCLKDAYAFALDSSEVTGGLLDALPNIKIITRFGVGYDNVDVKACTKRGIPVCIAPGAGAESVSEHCLALMLSAARRVTEMDKAVRKGTWKKFIGPSLYRKTLGIVGTGNIGRQLAKIVSGFDMQILAYDMYPNAAFAAQPNVRYCDTLEELLRQSDFISLHIPKTKDSVDFISMKQLRMMKPSAILINAARGGIVNERDLAQALREGVIAGAGLDTFDSEPINRDNPLLELDNVVLTTHNAGSSREGKNTVVRHALSKVAELDRGEKPVGLLNPEIFSEVTSRQ